MLVSPTLVHAGPLTAVFERVGLRWICHGHTEVLRSIHVAVRDAAWRTIPADVTGLAIDQRDDGFRIQFDARHVDGKLDFVWHGLITAQSDGTISFGMDGEARASFERNRIGLCVLHPVDGWVEHPLQIEPIDGPPGTVVWPSDVSPHQVARNVRALVNRVVPGLVAEVRLTGEIFETEDQRNWGDASFKTYGTPVDLPAPVTVVAGTRISQTATLRFQTEPAVTEPAADADAAAPATREPVGVSRRKIWLLPRTGWGGASGKSSRALPSPTDPVQLELTVETRPLPRVGVALPRGASSQTPGVRVRLSALNLGHLRVTLDLEDAGWAVDLERAEREAAQLRTPLEVAVLTSAANADDHLEALARTILRTEPQLARWMVFDRTSRTTTAALALLARRHLRPVAPHVPIGGGSDRHFAELNRHRPSPDWLDFVAYGMTPQAHDTDEATMMESVMSVGDVHRTARRFAPGLGIVVSPVTLQPRPIGRGDRRMSSSLAAAWTIAHLSELVTHGAESVTYFETVGPSGVLGATAADDRPVARVLAAVGAFRGASARLLRTSEPDAVAAIGLTDGRRAQVLVANLRAIETHVILPGERMVVRLEPHGVLYRDLGRSLAAR